MKKKKKNLTEMVFVLDRSGSMENLTSDTIGGFNSMIKKQKKEKGDAFVTTVLFDDEYEVLHDHVNIKKIRPITDKEYFARGCTALLDAVGKTINSVSNRLRVTLEEERPDKVIFVITTDGLENSSREFSKNTIKDMIIRQQDKYSWTFIFLGANMDAVGEAAGIGINADFARTYTADSIGTKSVYESVSRAMSFARQPDFDVKMTEDANYKDFMEVLDEIE